MNKVKIFININLQNIIPVEWCQITGNLIFFLTNCRGALSDWFYLNFIDSNIDELVYFYSYKHTSIKITNLNEFKQINILMVKIVSSLMVETMAVKLRK